MEKKNEIQNFGQTHGIFHLFFEHKDEVTFKKQMMHYTFNAKLLRVKSVIATRRPIVSFYISRKLYFIFLFCDSDW